MILLGLDPGNSFGWALARGEHVSFGVWRLGRARSERTGMPFHRLRLALAELGAIDKVFYEVSRFQKTKLNAHMSGGWEATVTAWCELNDVDYEPVDDSTVKSKVGGFGGLERAEGKRRMVKTMQLRGFVVTDDNAADALAVLEYGRGLFRQGELLGSAA